MEPWQFFDGHKIKEHFDREVAYARRKIRILEAYQHTETQPVIDVRAAWVAARRLLPRHTQWTPHASSPAAHVCRACACL